MTWSNCNHFRLGTVNFFFFFWVTRTGSQTFLVLLCTYIGKFCDLGILENVAEVKGGCFYGAGRIPPAKFRGVQVFTYKELELATDNFSEANVIGSGDFGVIYRGVLIDGTVAAVKKLHREGKQGERAFRVEVS